MSCLLHVQAPSNPCLSTPSPNHPGGSLCVGQGQHYICTCHGLRGTEVGGGTLFCVVMARTQWCGQAFRCGDTRWCRARHGQGLQLSCAGCQKSDTALALETKRLGIVHSTMLHVYPISDSAHRSYFPVCTAYTISPRCTATHSLYPHNSVPVPLYHCAPNVFCAQIFLGEAATVLQQY